MPRVAYSMEASLVGVGPVGDAVVVPFEDAVQVLDVGYNWGRPFGVTPSIILSTPVAPPSGRIDVPNQKLWTFGSYAIGFDATTSIVFQQALGDSTGSLHSTISPTGVMEPVMIGRYFVLPGSYYDAAFYFDGVLKSRQPVPWLQTVDMFLDGTCNQALDCTFQIRYENAEVVTVEAVGGGFGSSVDQRAQWTYSLAPMPLTAIPEPSTALLMLFGLACLSCRSLPA